MRKALLYVHGKGGSSKETKQIKPFCDGYDVYGIDLVDFTPWGTKEQIQNAFEALKKEVRLRFCYWQQYRRLFLYVCPAKQSC